jgi:hypothetical protein
MELIAMMQELPFRPDRRLQYTAVAVIALMALLGGLYLALDAAMGISLIPWYGMIYAVLGLLPGLPLIIRYRRLSITLVSAVFIGLIIAAPALDTSARKPFLRAAPAITPGMTLTEVDQRIQGVVRTPATPGTSGSNGVVVYRYTFGAGDTDALIVHVETAWSYNGNWFWISR